MTTRAYDSLDVVIPVYNEGENIGKVFRELHANVKVPLRILVVYDFDEDSTCPVVREFMKRQDNLVLVKNRYGRGVLNALKTGLESAGGAVLVLMADLADDVAKIDEMFAKLNEGYDIVCGSRYAKGGKQIGGPRLKGLLSRMAGLSLHYLTGLPSHDVSNSFKMYTREVLDTISIESDGGFEIGMEILIKAHFRGFRITEVPSIWRDRTAGESRFRFAQWLPKYLRWYFFALKCRAKALVSGRRRMTIQEMPGSISQARPGVSAAIGTQRDEMRIPRYGIRNVHDPSPNRNTQDTRTTPAR